VHDRAHVCANATVLDGAVIGEGAVVAAGAVIPAGTVVGKGEIWSGVPATCVGSVTAEDAARMAAETSAMGQAAHAHARETEKSWEEVRIDVASRLRDAARDPDFDAHIGLAQRMARERETPTRYH
jgi:hypothetical protein